MARAEPDQPGAVRAGARPPAGGELPRAPIGGVQPDVYQGILELIRPAADTGAAVRGAGMLVRWSEGDLPSRGSEYCVDW